MLGNKAVDIELLLLNLIRNVFTKKREEAAILVGLRINWVGKERVDRVS